MNYRNTRDAVWQTLLRSRISSLPVSVQTICRVEEVRLFTYEEGEALIYGLGLREHTVGNDAFSVGRNVFYDDGRETSRQRFSVAHELGHILLHAPIEPMAQRRALSEDDPIEREANIFASRLLAPLCVLHFMGVRSAEEIAEVCNISEKAAEIRYLRLCEIRERDVRMRERDGRGCFLLSPLERRVFENFREYADAYRR